MFCFYSTSLNYVLNLFTKFVTCFQNEILFVISLTTNYKFWMFFNLTNMCEALFALCLILKSFLSIKMYMTLRSSTFDTCIVRYLLEIQLKTANNLSCPSHLFTKFVTCLQNQIRLSFL